MSVTLLLSVGAALVAGQPFPFPQPPPPQMAGPCNYVFPGSPGNPTFPQCCLPQGCERVPGAPQFPWGPPPPPPLPFLQAVCCAEFTTCCPVDFTAFQPQYKCCPSDQTCNITGNKGTCVAYNNSITNGMTPSSGYHLTGSGLCPADGSLPAEERPGVPFYCSLNILIPNRRICPIGMRCVKDRTPNVNNGVCCLDSHCGERVTCADCVTPNNTVPTTGLVNGDPFPPQPVCSWLSQGDAYNVAPRCVQNCDNFPDKSCIGPNRVMECPYNATSGTGRKYNTGNCVRRCGLTGTGRSSRITNDGLPPPANATINKTACCGTFGGDYCCDSWGATARHCTLGYVLGGPQCGIPIRGTPNNYFNTPPYQIPPVYQNPFYRPPVQQQPWPMPYIPYWRSGASDSEVKSATEQKMALENKKQFFYPPMPFVPYMPGPVWNPYRRPVVPQRPIVPLDQQPSPYICSCDVSCGTYNDCCEDYADNCLKFNSTSPTSAPTEL